MDTVVKFMFDATLAVVLVSVVRTGVSPSFTV